MFNLVAYLIVMFGGINWFCIGLFQFDIIAGIFGSQAHFVSRFLYCIIGICAIYSLIALPIKKGRIYEPKKKKDKKEKEQDKDKKDNDEEELEESDETDNDDTEITVKEQPSEDDTIAEEDIDEIVIKAKPKAKSTKKITKIKKDL